MGRIIVIKAGSTLPSLIARKGDFEDWVLRGAGLIRDVIDARGGASLPAYEEISGIVITGSHDNVTDRLEWSERLAGWLPEAVERGIAVLGICYGHQVLAHALGGEVGDNPKGWEFGTVDVHLTASAREDGLLGKFETPLKAHVTHTQTVLRLPEKARRLAFSAMDENQAFAVGDRAWGVQFHPEHDAEVAREYIRQNKKTLQRQGQDPEGLIARCQDTPCGTEILRRFAAIANGTAGS